MSGFSIFVIAFFVTFFIFLIGEPVIRWLLRLFGFYAVVEEGTWHVYVLFGKVIGVVKEPGLQWLWLRLGPRALVVNWMGQHHVLDVRLDQQYLRSLPVNSEEGAPMGIGVWYEMVINDPVAYLFKNIDPRGSLSANVSSAAVRTLSNMPLDDMLGTRHIMSRAVRAEVSPKSEEWGYKLGSVYVRKVHFRDENMIRQIEEKVVNRLRQVTSAIRQDGANRVSIITSSAERKAAIEFAKAEAMRPKIVGEAIHQISKNPEVANTMFEILETQNILAGEANVTLLPQGHELLKQMLGAEAAKE
ncbi:MAG: SPFH domain-containing protein [Candidatus Promineifilaceae bacterium]|nr:SPFH domain-containing protein [Candidatus Promineifilaceae bacterium]